MDVFAVIPARGGSTRVPNKNIRKVGSKPLIAHTIEQAAAADTIDRCIVSTDDDEIAATAEEYGGEVPFRRPPELATDEAKSPPVVEHALEWMREQGEVPDIVVMLQVTTPLRSPTDIDGAIRQLQEHESATSVVAVTQFDTPPQWALEMKDDSSLTARFDKDLFWTDEIPRSQDLETLYHPSGAIFAAEVEAFCQEQNFYTEYTIGYKIPPIRSVDIDEPFDLTIARALFRTMKNE